MNDNEKEEILTEYLKHLMKNNINQFMILVGGILTTVTEESNAGHLKVTISDKKDKPLWTLLFATDEELIPELDDFLNAYDEGNK